MKGDLDLQDLAQAASTVMGRSQVAVGLGWIRERVAHTVSIMQWSD